MSQRQISRDLECSDIASKVSRIDRLGRKNTGRPKGAKAKRKFPRARYVRQTCAPSIRCAAPRYWRRDRHRTSWDGPVSAVKASDDGCLTGVYPTSQNKPALALAGRQGERDKSPILLNNGGEEGIRTLDTGLPRITV